MEETQSQSESPAPKSSQKGITTIVAIVIVVLLVVGGIIGYTLMKSKPTSTTSSVDNNNNTQMATTPTAEPTSTESAMTSDKIVVSGKNFSFTPSTINVKKGEKATIVFKDVQGMHDFNVDELNVKTPVVQTGNEAEVSFTPTKAGTYEFYCSVGNHRAMGMKGTLIVE